MARAAPRGNDRLQGGAPLTQSLVSILTPSFNQARWLPDNIRSVAEQSYASVEHLVMDGGSTDGSVQILESAASNLIWESAPDQGQSDAINKAFARSAGAIIGWLNSDDAYFSRDVVAAAVDIFDRHPEVGVVYGHAVLVNGAGKVLQVLWSPKFAPSLLRAYNLIYQPTVFVRRSALQRDYLVDPAFEYQMDRELWLHLSGRTRFHRLNQIVAIDRHHDQRKSYTRLDLSDLDETLLRQRYRISTLAANPILHRTVRIVFRVIGLSKVVQAAKGGDALPLEASSVGSIALRQLAQLRRWMPSGDR